MRRGRRRKEHAMDLSSSEAAKPAAEAAAFNWSDPFLLDEQLSEEERLIWQTAHSFAEDKLRPRVVEAYAEERTDRALFFEMGELGLLGLTVPQDYGGAGASYVAYGL